METNECNGRAADPDATRPLTEDADTDSTASAPLSVRQSAFLSAYRVCGNISRAARSAQVHRTDHYRWMEDPEYAEAFAIAHEEACDALEEEARTRAVEGWEEPVIYKGEMQYTPVTDDDGNLVTKEDGQPLLRPLTIRKKDTNLLIFLLKGAKPDKFRENFRGEISGPGGKPLRSSIDLTNLTDEQLEQLRRLADAVTQPRGDRSGDPAAEEE
jgi:hypothetical protein